MTRVLLRVALAYDNETIARDLNISEETVKKTLGEIYDAAGPPVGTRPRVWVALNCARILRQSEGARNEDTVP